MCNMVVQVITCGYDVMYEQSKWSGFLRVNVDDVGGKFTASQKRHYCIYGMIIADME